MVTELKVLFFLTQIYSLNFSTKLYLVDNWCLLQYIEETEELAMNGLRNNRHILDMITEELMEKSRITGLVSYKTYFVGHYHSIIGSIAVIHIS